jgi:hypothetical protein
MHAYSTAYYDASQMMNHASILSSLHTSLMLEFLSEKHVVASQYLQSPVPLSYAGEGANISGRQILKKFELQGK